MKHAQEMEHELLLTGFQNRCWAPGGAPGEAGVWHSMKYSVQCASHVAACYQITHFKVY